MVEVLDKEYWSREVTTGIKGYMCLCVLIHHLYQFTGFFSQSYFGHFLNILGEWSVSIFFFISGYGLFYSFMSNCNKYMSSFISKRVLPLYIKYVIFVLLYMVFNYKHLSWKLVFTSLIWGDTILSYGWYFQILLALYLIFYLSFRFCDKKRSLLVYGFLLIPFYFLCVHTGQRFLSVVPFSFGIIIAFFKNRWDQILKKVPLLITAGSFLFFFCGFLFRVHSQITGRIKANGSLTIGIDILSELAVIIFVLCICYLVRSAGLFLVVNPVSKWISGYSLEIYACQGLVLSRLYPYLGKTWLFVIDCMICVMLLSVIMHLVIDKIFKILG